MNYVNVEEIKNNVVTSREVTELLEISRARLSQLVKTGKLKPIKKNLFLTNDVLLRKEQQTILREKYYKINK
jgi:predicted XRE-type DNA-binding protein